MCIRDSFLVSSITALPVAYHCLFVPVFKVSLYVSSNKLSAVSQLKIASWSDSTLLPTTIVSPELSLDTATGLNPIPLVSVRDEAVITVPVFQPTLRVTDSAALKSLWTAQDTSTLPKISNLTPPFSTPWYSPVGIKILLWTVEV